MSFLRSIITDARPRKPIDIPLHGPSAIRGRKEHTWGGNAFGAEQTFPDAPDQTGHLNESLSIREGAGDADMGHTPNIPVDNPLSPLDKGLQKMRKSVELESPLSMPADKPGSIPGDKSPSPLDPVTPPAHALESDRPGDSRAEQRLTQQPIDMIIPDRSINAPKDPDHKSSSASPGPHGLQTRASGREEMEPAGSPASMRDFPGRKSTDNRHRFESLAQTPEVLTIQADARQTTTSTSPPSNRLIESSVLDASGQVSGQDTMPDSVAVGNEFEKALAHAGTSHHVSSRVDKQADIKSTPNQKDFPGRQKRGQPKGVLYEAKLVSREATPMESPRSSDVELALSPQTAGKTAWSSTSPPGSGPSEPGSPKQHTVRLARPLASPERARLTPEDDALHSRPPLRSSEMKHEVPRVQIGQIDVLIESAPQSAAKPAPAPSPIDLASRHYLRRL